jgi:hypothetical protein
MESKRVSIFVLEEIVFFIVRIYDKMVEEILMGERWK